MVTFIPSPTDKVKFQLYQQCDTALYTPPNEHFGIVPIEALDQRRPVIVCDSGGPAETVLEDITGTKVSRHNTFLKFVMLYSLIFPQIAKPCGELLAEAMLHHMNKRDWPELDTDEGYAKQVCESDQIASPKGRGDCFKKNNSSYRLADQCVGGLKIPEILLVFFQRHRLETEFSTRGFCGNIDRAIAEMMGTLEISSSEPTTTPLVDTIVHQPTATEVYSKPQQYNKAAHSRRAQA